LFFSLHPDHCHPLLVLALWLWLSFFCHPFPHLQFHTRDPPLEQVLVGLGLGGVSFVTMGSCGGGDGWVAMVGYVVLMSIITNKVKPKT
jgi:hypothetical protein